MNDYFDPSDIEQGRVVAALSYLVFFLPLILRPASSYGRFHANQGLLLLLVGLAGQLVLGFVPVIGATLHTLWRIAWLVLLVLGVLNATQGKARRLPFFGDVALIK